MGLAVLAPTTGCGNGARSAHPYYRLPQVRLAVLTTTILGSRCSPLQFWARSASPLRMTAQCELAKLHPYYRLWQWGSRCSPLQFWARGARPYKFCSPLQILLAPTDLLTTTNCPPIPNPLICP